MRKTLLAVLFVGGMIVTFSSCKKEYDCTCSSLTSLGETYDKTAKGKDAESACDDAGGLLKGEICVVKQ